MHLGDAVCSAGGVPIGRVTGVSSDGRETTLEIQSYSGAKDMETYLRSARAWEPNCAAGAKWEFDSSLSYVTDRLNNLRDADLPIPNSLDSGIALDIANEQDEAAYKKAVALVKDGLAELKRRKQQIKDKARELKAMRKALRNDKAAFIEAANQYSTGGAQ